MPRRRSPQTAPGGEMEFLNDPETWVAVGFVLFLGVLLWTRVPGMIGTSLDARAAAIAKELEDARKLRSEAEALLAEYQQKRNRAEDEAGAILSEAKAEAERYAAEARASIKAQIERRSRQAEEKIAQAESQAVAEIRGLAADAAVAAAEKLIAARLDDNRSADLIKRSLG